MADPMPVRMKLLKEHRHAGEDHQEGTVLTVPATTATWLKNRRIAVEADATAEAAPVKSKEAQP